MKPFDLEAAKNGAPVCTRNGKDVRIICFDRVSKDLYPIIALIKENNGDEVLYTYTLDGKVSKYSDSPINLVMKPVKEEGWINLCFNAGRTYLDGFIYKDEETAISTGSSRRDYLRTIRIEWEH